MDNDYLLNCAASSSAGVAATQLARLAGATVIGTARTGQAFRKEPSIGILHPSDAF